MGICLVGNFCIDIIIRGVPRMPAWGQEVAGDDYTVVSSGQTAYTATALRALGEPVATIGAVGDDAWGARIRADLQERGIDVAALESVRGGRTALSVAIVRPDGERAFISDFASLNLADESVIERGWFKIEEADTVCFLGLFSWPGLFPARLAPLMARAREARKATVLDTGWDPAGWTSSTREGLRAVLAETSIFMPNMSEATAISGSDEPEAAVRLLSAMGPSVVVIKLGSHGSIALDGGRIHRQPAVPVEVVDTVGAGDVFNAGFLHARSRGHPIKDCLQTGTRAAALYISRKHDRFPSATEVKDD